MGGMILFSGITLSACNTGDAVQSTVGLTKTGTDSSQVSKKSGYSQALGKNDFKQNQIALRIGISEEALAGKGGFKYFEEQSYRQEFLGVGLLTNYDNQDFILNKNAKKCTATWVGSDNKNYYFLTASHCVRYINQTTDGLTFEFKTWNHKKIIDKNATVYVLPSIINLPSSSVSVINDIAIVEMKKDAKSSELVDMAGHPLNRPIFYDIQENLLDKHVNMVGYGVRVAGDKIINNGGKRLWGENIIGVDRDGELHVQYTNSVDKGATILHGDSGSALWLNSSDNLFSITGVASEVHIEDDNDKDIKTTSKFANIQPHIKWIKTIFPNIRLYSELSEVEKIPATTTIKTGEYELHSSVDRSLLVSDSQKLVKYRSPRAFHSWQIVFDPLAQAYQIIPKTNSTAVLAIVDGKLHQTANTKSINQYWIFKKVPNSSDSYFVVNKQYPSKVLDIQKNVIADGSFVDVWGYHGRSNQQFVFEAPKNMEDDTLNWVNDEMKKRKRDLPEDIDYGNDQAHAVIDFSVFSYFSSITNPNLAKPELSRFMDNLTANYQSMSELFWNHEGGANGTMVKTFDVVVGLEYVFRYQSTSPKNLTVIVAYPDDEIIKAKRLGILPANADGYFLYDELKSSEDKVLRFVPKTDKVKVLFLSEQENLFRYAIFPVLYNLEEQFD